MQIYKDRMYLCIDNYGDIIAHRRAKFLFLDCVESLYRYHKPQSLMMMAFVLSDDVNQTFKSQKV